jgi:hypothetical protein
MREVVKACSVFLDAVNGGDVGGDEGWNPVVLRRVQAAANSVMNLRLVLEAVIAEMENHEPRT